MCYKYLLFGLKCLIDLCVLMMKDYEENGNLDPDGVPMESDYGKLSYILATFRDCYSETKKAIENE